MSLYFANHCTDNFTRRKHQSKAGRHSNAITGTHYLLHGDCPNIKLQPLLSPWLCIACINGSSGHVSIKLGNFMDMTLHCLSVFHLMARLCYLESNDKGGNSCVMNSLQPAVQSVCTGDGKVKIECLMALLNLACRNVFYYINLSSVIFFVSLNWGCREFSRWV